MLSLIHWFWAHGYKVFKILKNVKEKSDIPQKSNWNFWSVFMLWFH